MGQILAKKGAFASTKIAAGIKSGKMGRRGPIWRSENSVPSAFCPPPFRATRPPCARCTNTWVAVEHVPLTVSCCELTGASCVGLYIREMLARPRPPPSLFVFHNKNEIDFCGLERCSKKAYPCRRHRSMHHDKTSMLP